MTPGDSNQMTDSSKELIKLSKSSNGNNTIPALEIWYKKHYRMQEIDWTCVWAVLLDTWTKCNLSWFKDNIIDERTFSKNLTDVLHNSLPSRNWYVGGPGKGMLSHYDNDVYQAQIRAIMSAFRLTEAKMFDKMEIF